MYLKSIEIKGFKSFAEKINLEFDKGIAAIVGPNGSGKSNIADAVRWVLGEQSIKNLRGSKMEDVIFSGTDTRKALGFAEVSITLDNGDGFLPIEYSEVVVTRRLFRSGESEYYLNRTGCRLKDINELFMDTGIGKEGYSIIGQGRIDEILSSKAEDRRKIFEEAAGIVKYKTRKDEAERKLQRTEENLLRLGDIIDELQRQVGPLYEQSEVAKAYILMRDELKKLELSLFIDSLEKLNRQKTDIQEKVKECRKQVYNKNNMVNRLETEFSSLETRIQQLDEELKEVQERVFRSLNLAEKKEGEIKVLNQRIQGEKENIERHKTEIAETENETAALEEEKQKRMQEMQDLKKELEGKKQIIDTFQANLDSIGAQVGKDEAKVEEIKTGIIENLNRISELNSKANSLKTLNQTIYMRKAQLLEEMQNIDDRIGALKAERDDLKKTLDGLKKQLTENARRRSGLVNKLDSLRNQRLLLEQKQKNLREELGIHRSKLALLQQMEREYEGYSRSVKSLLEACDRKKGLERGIVGAVAKLITVRPGLERAIETALGYNLQSIVTNTEEDAETAIDYLKRNSLGRATFLPISSIKPRYLSRDEEKALGMEGCIGRASSLVGCPDRIRNIIDNLLGRVVVVDTLDSGIKMARAFGYGFRIVTSDGDVINTGGSMTGGSSYSKETGLLQRKGEIQSLQGALDGKADETGRLDHSIRELAEMEQDIELRIQETANSYHQLELQRTRLTEMLEAKAKDLEDRKAKKLQFESEKLTLESDYYETQQQIEEILKSIKEKENENRQMEEQIKSLQRTSSEKKQDRDNIMQQITAHRVEAARIAQKLEDVQSGFQRAVSMLQKARMSVIDREKEIEINRKNIEKLEDGISVLRQEIEVLVGERNRDSVEMTKLQQTKSECQQRMKEKEQAVKEINKEISELEKRLHRYEVQLTKVDMEIGNLHDRMWEEYEVTRIHALDYKCDIEDEKAARSRILELKANIKELGNVNINAIEEYARVKERFDFLNSQKKDLEEARDSLNKIIKEMMDTMKKQFAEQFQVINESFNRVFRELFGGGKAQVLLSDQANILESGIDIIAQPPGKKLQQISLLSGGEKALTAIALLFAILSVKPSPFCILDEIEAALDDANVERFGEFLKKLSADIQFILITHRKGTIEIANNLYGVTMQEKGISKLVSVRLEDMVS